MLITLTTYCNILVSIKDISTLILSYDLKNFTLSYSYSLDSTNFSEYQNDTNFDIPISITEIYVRIKFTKNSTLTELTTIYTTPNVNKPEQYVDLKSIKFDDKYYDLLDMEISDDYDDLKFITEYDMINMYPKWNLYDNHYISIKRWIMQCNAIAESYGHTCIYFKTKVTSTNNTLKQNHEREVIDVKKLPLMIVENEIGHIDQLVYSDWDMPLQDDFITHIVWDKFKIAFGEDAIPNSKDYLFLPLLNKMFKVNIVQPVNGYMGKVAWWEVYLVKYEDDETVNISSDIVNEYSDISEFADAFNVGDDLLDISGTNPLTEFEGNTIEQSELHINEGLNTSDKIDAATVITKRTATEGYTNKLVDSTNYISLKESDKYRQFYDARLSIVNVTPDANMYPVTMYSNASVSNNVVAMEYKLSDFNYISKNNLKIISALKLSMDYVPIKIYGSNVISLIDSTGSLYLLSIVSDRSNYPKLHINDTVSNNNYDINYDFIENNIYNISLGISQVSDLWQLSFKVYTITDKKKVEVYSNIYSIVSYKDIETGYIHLFGGKFLSGNIQLYINNKEIFKDYCNPLLKYDVTT